MKRHLMLLVLAVALAVAGPAYAVTVTNTATAGGKVTETNPLNQQFYRQPNVLNSSIAAGASDSTAILDVRGYNCLRLHLFGIPAGGVAKTRFEITVRAFAVADRDTSYAMTLTSVALGSSQSKGVTGGALVDSVGDFDTIIPTANAARAGSFIYVVDPLRHMGTWTGATSGYPFGLDVAVFGEMGTCVKANFIQISVRNISTSGTAKVRIEVEGTPL